jgi:hypothetical protein
MVELVVAVVGLASVGIFLAHAIEAYRAYGNAEPKPRAHGRTRRRVHRGTHAQSAISRWTG